MSDSETTRSNQSPLPVTLRRELLEAQSDVEHGRHTSDTQSDVGFRLHRRNWNDGPHETQSDVEFRVRGRRERLRNREYEENEKNQRLSDPNQFAQFNRNANATGAKQSPVGQRIPRKSGYSTDPGEGRPRRRVPPFRTPESKTKDDGYVHPSDYYKLPEYSVGDRQARTLDLKQLKSRGQTHVKGQPEIQGSPQNSHEKRTDIKNSTQYQPSPNLGRTQGQRGITPLQKGAPRIPNIQPSPDLGRTPGPPRIPNNQDNRGAMPTQQYHGSPRFGHRPGPVRPAQEDMHPPEGHGVAHRNEHVQRHHNVHTSKDYVDMSQSSPMSQRNASPSKNQIPSYEEALSRRREITPPRGRSPIEQGSPSVPVKEWHRQHNDYEPMRTTNQSFARPNISSQSATKPPVNHAVNNHTPVRQFNSAHQNSPQLRNQGNRLSNGKTRSLERHMEPLGGLGSLQDDDTRIQDVERDSGNSSNVTWSGSEALHSGYQEGRSNSGITTRREMHPDVAINDTDSALTESPSPTYSSSGLTPSPQQPHFPQSVRIPSPASADTKVPLATSTAVVAPTIRGSPLRGPPPPYHRRWGGGTEGMARDSLGYASEGEQKLGEPGSPSSFLVDQRPPSPNSTVLAWDTSAARRTLPSNNNSTQPQEGDTRNGAKMIQLVIYKNPGLGFSITGGWNSQGNPYKPNDTGIFVTKIAPLGPADGTLQPGDKILEVNGQDFRNVTHDDAVQLLRKSNPVSLVVKRDS
ncbi:uncharacterized protein [Amphiura filiformis]|uniref:uncharacterized protein n=1 Tax=Amphiura filiformis TaxID=82378 RepID=UPI003B216870